MAVWFINGGLFHCLQVKPGCCTVWLYGLTLTGNIHTEVDAVDGVYIDGARFHKHCCVPLSAFSPSRVRGFVLSSQVGLSLHHPPSQLSAVRTPTDQYLAQECFSQTYTGLVEELFSKPLRVPLLGEVLTLHCPWFNNTALMVMDGRPHLSQ